MFESAETATLHAPKGSATMKCSEKGIGQQVHKFTFTKVVPGTFLATRHLYLFFLMTFSIQFYEIVCFYYLDFWARVDSSGVLRWNYQVASAGLSAWQKCIGVQLWSN